jgi:serine/threonine protein kinase
MALPRSFRQAAARLGGLVASVPPLRAGSEIPRSGARRRAGLTGIVGQGRYQVDGPIGSGAMGIVYSAWHTQLHKPVALKVLRREYCTDENVVLRFLNEARTASSVQSPHVVDVLDCGRLDDGSPYIVMELLEGGALSETLEVNKSLSTPLAVEVAMQVAEGLAAAHAVNVIHRDLKPENVVLCPCADGRWLVKIVDFGIAKALDTGEELTQVGQIFGTPHYMSPEQTLGHAVDHRSDIYALGVILYEMLSGRLPVEGRHVGEVLACQRHAPLPPLRSQRRAREIAPRLESIVHRCLEKDPDRRYQTAKALVRELRLFAQRAAPQGEQRGATEPPTWIDLQNYTPNSTPRRSLRIQPIVPNAAASKLNRNARNHPTQLNRTGATRSVLRTLVACGIGAAVGLTGALVYKMVAAGETSTHATTAQQEP